MKKILFLVCSNGYGHFKRCARVTNKLLEIDNDIIIDFISKESTYKNQSDWNITKKLSSNNRFNFIKGESTIEINGTSKNKQSINYNGISWLDNKMIEDITNEKIVCYDCNTSSYPALNKYQVVWIRCSKCGVKKDINKSLSHNNISIFDARFKKKDV